MSVSSAVRPLGGVLRPFLRPDARRPAADRRHLPDARRSFPIRQHGIRLRVGVHRAGAGSRVRPVPASDRRRTTAEKAPVLNRIFVTISPLLREVARCRCGASVPARKHRRPLHDPEPSGDLRLVRRRRCAGGAARRRPSACRDFRSRGSISAGGWPASRFRPSGCSKAGRRPLRDRTPWASSPRASGRCCCRSASATASINFSKAHSRPLAHLLCVVSAIVLLLNHALGVKPSRHYGVAVGRDDLADAGCQRIHGEGLRDHRHAGIEKPAGNRRILRIAGHEQHLQVRPRESARRPRPADRSGRAAPHR